MKHAAQEAFNTKLDQFNTLKAYTSNRMFHSGGCLSYFAGAATDNGFSWSAVCKYNLTEEQLNSLQEGSTDIFRKNSLISLIL